MAVRDYSELQVYQVAFQAAMEIYTLAKEWPVHEKYSYLPHANPHDGQPRKVVQDTVMIHARPSPPAFRFPIMEDPVV
jgi:hypothetical protein